MFVFYLIPILTFLILFRKKKISLNVFLLLMATILCTWAAEVSMADGFIRGMGSSELIKEYENYAMPGPAIIVGIISVGLFVYASISIFREKK